MIGAVKWVGHRGYPASYPENSIPGLVAACNAGAQGVELDVQMSHDGVPVVVHDATLSRTAGVNKNVLTEPFEQLSAYSVHEQKRFSDQFDPTPLASLQQVVQALQPYSEVTIFVELKSETLKHHSAEAFIQAVWKALKGVQQQCVIIAFDLPLLREVQAHLTVPVGWVLSRYNEDSRQQVSEAPVDFLICDYKKLPRKPEPLWPGPWQWFIYDITQLEPFRDCVARGAQWLETWDIKTALNLHE